MSKKAKKDSETLPRNTASQTTDQQNAQGIQASSRNPNEGARPPRVRLKGNLKLDYPKQKLDLVNFHYRWFEDNPTKPGRIQSAIDAYWEYHEEDGKKVTRPSGANTMYLMKLPMEYYEEDMELKRQDVGRTIAEQMTLGANEYAPDNKGNPEGGKSARVSQVTSEYAE